MSLPLWPEGKNPLAKEWTSLKSVLLDLDPNWLFWRDWYQALLDGTPHPGLSPSEQKEIYQTIALFEPEFWDEGAAVVNGRIAELVQEVKERRGFNIALETPKELPGTSIEFTGNQFEIIESISPDERVFDQDVQNVLCSKLQDKVAKLLEASATLENQYPELKTVLEDYQQQLSQPLDALNSAEFWTHSVALMAQAKAYLAKNDNKTLTPALEPELVASLEEIAQLNGGFVLGFPKPKSLTENATQALQAPLTELQQPVLEWLDLLHEQNAILGEKLRQLLAVLEQAVRSGAWGLAGLEVAATSTIYNLLLEFGRWVIKIDKAMPKSGTVVLVGSVLVSNISLDAATIGAIWDLVLGHPSLLAQFIAPFPELNHWMNYVVERAKLLKPDDHEMKTDT